jgi:hypothetical protein
LCSGNANTTAVHGRLQAFFYFPKNSAFPENKAKTENVPPPSVTYLARLREADSGLAKPGKKIFRSDRQAAAFQGFFKVSPANRGRFPPKVREPGSREKLKSEIDFGGES